MEEVNNIQEAEDWFLNNHEGEVLCVGKETSMSVNCYPDAKAFFINDNY